MSVILSPAARAAIERINTDSARTQRSDSASSDVGGESFGDVLKDALSKAGEAERAAEASAGRFARGEEGIHETILAQERAGIAVRYAVTVKNKALEAYREIMNTQI